MPRLTLLDHSLYVVRIFLQSPRSSTETCKTTVPDNHAIGRSSALLLNRTIREYVVNERRFLRALFIVLMLGLTVWPFIVFLYEIKVIPTYGEICSKNEYTGNKECTKHHTVYVAAWHVFHFVTKEHGFITALATIILAFFTLRLWASTHRLWTEAKNAREIARLQTRAAILAQIPFVGWIQVKMVEQDAKGIAIEGRDPVLGGPVPEFWRPVFVVHNAGPTKIFTEYYSTKTEIVSELAKEPHFGVMLNLPHLVRPEETHPFTPSEPVNLPVEERAEIDAGTKRLWAYAFVIYRDFLHERHQLGIVAKWDPKRGFVMIQRENYTYNRSQKEY